MGPWINRAGWPSPCALIATVKSNASGQRLATLARSVRACLPSPTRCGTE